MCSMPFTLTHQLRSSIFNASRSQLRRYATSNLAFAPKPKFSHPGLKLEARAEISPKMGTYRFVGITTLGLAGFSLLAAQQEIHCEREPTSRVWRDEHIDKM